MEYVPLGRSGVRVSRLCLGTMNFGARVPEGPAHAIMDRARERGINFLDTANGYGGGGLRGLTEEIIGQWFAQGGGRRESMVLATKVYGATGPGVNDRGLSARHILRAVEDSLRRLQTDRIDLYQMHHVDRDTPWEEIWQAMGKLIADGKVVYVGSSNFAGWHIAQANQAARDRHLMGLVSEQCKYSLLCRTPELEVFPAAAAYGLGIIPWSPLGGGALAGAVRQARTEGRRAEEGTRQLIEKHRPQLERYEALCEELGRAPADVALRWTLAQPGVTAPIIGPRTVEQLEACVRALEIDLPGEALARLDEIFPGPGGQAPEAWAW